VSIDECGFIGKGIEAYKIQIREKYKDHFKYFEDFNCFLNNLKFRLEVKDTEDQRQVISLLFMKALETFQAIYILCEYGLTSDSVTLNRALFETTVHLLYCSKDEESFKSYIAIDVANKIKWSNASRQNPEEFRKGFAERAAIQIPNLKNMIKKCGKNPNWKSPSLLEMARGTGNVKLYQTFYRIASGTTHSEPASLERYIGLDKDGTIKKILWGPREEEIDILLITAIEFMEYLCEGLYKIFGEPKEDEMKPFIERKMNTWKEVV
jgi:hypothetical protein